MRRSSKLLSLLTLVFTILVLGGCVLPSLENREFTKSLSDIEALSTKLGSAIQPFAKKHQGQSGVHLLGNPQDAFAVRVLLAKNAQRTLDLQYYIWQNDVTGTLMLEAVNEAAERGVRVRLLLDDNGIADLDETLLSLNRHKNIQVRIFNPFAQRKLKWLGYLTDFSRVNRRMHNKSFTADNSVTVIGGRNIGDDYFGATNGILKQDLDLLAIGDVVQDVSTDFDRYWVSQSAFPIQDIATSNKQSSYTTAEYIPKQTNNPMRDTYIEDIQSSSFIKELLAQELSLEWTHTTMISDNPEKGLGKGKKKQLLITKLSKIIGQPETSLILVSPYFVPTKAGKREFIELARNGVSVQVLTNAMKATDVLPVHAGYAKHRKALLKAGITLFELRPTTLNSGKIHNRLGPFGSSASSLHAKTFAIDSQRIFVGSFNFDPRSMLLNTELGFVIQSPTLAKQIELEFNQLVRTTSYEVKLDENGKLYWLEQNGDDKITHKTEPGLTLLNRAALSILSILPIDWLL